VRCGRRLLKSSWASAVSSRFRERGAPVNAGALLIKGDPVVIGTWDLPQKWTR
jgi:hypothetical protein